MGYVGSQYSELIMTRSFRSRPFVFCLWMLAFHLSIPAAEGFKIFTQPLLINSERGEVSSYVVITDSKRYNFLPPIGWNVSANATEKTVTFLSEDHSASIGLKFIAGVRKASEASGSAATHAEIATRYPDSKIQQEFPCHTSANEGVGFDLERHIEDRPPVSIRFAIVPFEDSTVEFTLTTETRRFAKHRWALANLMTSFRIDPGGRPK